MQILQLTFACYVKLSHARIIIDYLKGIMLPSSLLVYVKPP